VKKDLNSRIYTPIFIMPALVLYFIFFIIPNVGGLFVGFTDWTTLYFKSPRFIGLDNFISMFSDPIFFKSIFNTFYYTIVTTILKVSLGLIFAVILNNKVKLTNLYRAIIFAPIMMSTVVTGLIFSAIYHPEKGLLNVFLGKIGLEVLQQQWLLDSKFAMNSICAMDVWMGTGMLMAIFLAGLQTVPKDFYESATIDGASSRQMFFKITIPLIVPSITVNTSLGLISGLKVFGQVFVLTNGGPNDATQVVGTFLFKYFGQGMLGYTSAVGIVFTIFISLVSYFQIGTMRKKEVEM